jgi:hypothetical protein
MEECKHEKYMQISPMLVIHLSLHGYVRSVGRRVWKHQHTSVMKRPMSK